MYLQSIFFFGALCYALLKFLSDFQSSFLFVTPSSNIIKKCNNCSSDLEEFLNYYQKLFWVTTCVVEHT